MLQRMSSSTSWPACRTARSLWHQQRLITKPVSRRRTACIVAFKDARRAESLHSMVTVPRVTNFELLGLERGSSDAQEIKQAYEERVGSQTQAAYSADTLFSRAVLLKSAVECLLDPQRAGIEQKLANSESPGLKVFQSDLPGVLVVLQEVGCHAEVLALGPAWLEQHSSSPDAPDVAACIALAYCDRASLALDALEQQEGSAQVSQAGPSPLLSACEDLERAAQLCRLHDVAHQLQEQIADALKGYAHAYATELVALPLGPECASRRKRGVAIIRSAVRKQLSAEGDRRGQAAHADAVALLRATRPHLTAREQHMLLNDLMDSHALAAHIPTLHELRKSGSSSKRIGGSGVAAGLAHELYCGAMALVAEGIARAQPVLVVQADELLERLEASEAMQSQMSVRLDRACCAVLLGRAPSHSLQLLGMPEVLQAAAARAGGRGLKGASATVRMHGNATISSQDGPDWEACQYVMDRSPDAPDDMAPGLHALMKGWLCEAVLGGLREWQRPAAPPMATVTSAAATPSIPSQLSCLLTATAADSCTADIVGNQAAVTPAGSAARGGKNAPVLATVVTSQLQAYWFTKPLVALYAKAYPIARLLPPLLATLHFLCTCSERVATALAALMSRSAAHAHRHAQRRDAARAQAAREHDVRVKAAAEEAVAYRRQQELQWRMEAEAEALWGSAEGDGGGEEGGGSAGHVGEAGHASEMESVRARLGMGMVEEEGVALPSPPSSGMRARSAGGSGMGRGGQGSPDEGEWVEAVGAVHHGSGGGDGAGAEGKVSRGPRGGDGWVGGSASGAAATALAPCDVLQQQQQQQRQQQPLLRQGHQLQQPDDEEEEDASRARAVQSQLMEMERAMWDSGAHVRMQKLMEDFQSKAATNTMMSRAGGPRAPPSPLPPLHVFLPSVALTVAATTAAVLGVFGHGWGQSGLPATVAGVNVGAAATAVQEAPALRKGWGRGV